MGLDFGEILLPKKKKKKGGGGGEGGGSKGEFQDEFGVGKARDIVRPESDLTKVDFSNFGAKAKRDIRRRTRLPMDHRDYVNPDTLKNFTEED